MSVSTIFCFASKVHGIPASLVARTLAFLSLAVMVLPFSTAWVDRWPPRSLVSLTTLMTESNERHECCLNLALVSAEVLNVKHFLGAGMAPRSFK